MSPADEREALVLLRQIEAKIDFVLESLAGCECSPIRCEAHLTAIPAMGKRTLQ